VSKKTEPAIVKSSLVDFAEKMSDWLKDAILKGARPPLSSARIQIWSNTFRSFWVPVDADRIDSFISQFPRGMEWVGEALVDAVDYYDQRFFASALSSALGPLMNDGARLCLFGGARKSSSLMSYVIDRRLLLPYQELGEALSRSGDGKSIIFIDDCMLSGTQAIHIFSELIGVWHRKPYKYHVGPLSERQIENLRSFDIVFLPALGTNLAANRLSKFLKANKILHRIEIARVVPWLSTAGMRDLGQGILLGEGESLREPERQLADPIFGPTSAFLNKATGKLLVSYVKRSDLNYLRVELRKTRGRKLGGGEAHWATAVCKAD